MHVQSGWTGVLFVTNIATLYILVWLVALSVSCQVGTAGVRFTTFSASVTSAREFLHVLHRISFASAAFSAVGSDTVTANVDVRRKVLVFFVFDLW